MLEDTHSQIRIPAVEQPVSVGWYVVAYFDILGQQDKMDELKLIDNPSLQRERFKQLSFDMVRMVYRFRVAFNELFQSFLATRPPDHIKQLPSDIQQQYFRRRTSEIRFQTFSDTLIVYFPLKSKEIFQSRVIYAIVYGIALVMPAMLSQGIPIRGGIDLGHGAELCPGEIYGPVLKDAYTLEHEVARYPRIMVGNAFVECLDTIPSDIDEAPYNQLHQELAAECKAVISKDSEGAFYIDYLGTKIRAMKQPHWAKVVQDAYRFVHEQLKQFEKQSNSKLAERYRELSEYFLDRCPGILYGL
ncbi:MAG: hypothetical protein IT445_09355 [Phycisphaeraceae bacterium]|nr:hypothetical protein [Phycisphaeraceae bacterium]